MSIEDAASQFQLPDLRAALGDYIHRMNLASKTAGKSTSVTAIGGRRISTTKCNLPFRQLEVWHQLRLQTKTYHAPHRVLPAATVRAFPPSNEYPFGSRDSVIANIDQAKEWPLSGLQGKFDTRII